MYQFVFEAEISKNKYYLTLRNTSTKAYLCKRELVTTELFKKGANH
jgi:hypothetical protein